MADCLVPLRQVKNIGVRCQNEIFAVSGTFQHPRSEIPPGACRASAQSKRKPNAPKLPPPLWPLRSPPWPPSRPLSKPHSTGCCRSSCCSRAARLRVIKAERGVSASITGGEVSTVKNADLFDRGDAWTKESNKGGGLPSRPLRAPSKESPKAEAAG